MFGAQIEALGALTSVSTGDHTGHDSTQAIAASILATAPPRFALAGLSMGGSVALEILRQAPARVAKLALIDTEAGSVGEETRAGRLAFIEMARSGRFSEITRDHLLDRLIHPSRRAEPALVESIIAMAEATGPAAFIRQETAILTRPDYRALLASVACPTLVLVGDGDILTPPARAREMAARIPNARLEILPRCGHLSTLERPAETTALMKSWLLC